MAAFGKTNSFTQYGREIDEAREQRHYFELGLRISELPGAAFAAITLLYVVTALARLAW
jgi:hypothetical protein